MAIRVFSSIEQGIHRVSYWLSRVSMAVILAMMLMVAVDVIMRYVFNNPIIGTVDFIELAIVFLGFCAIAYSQLAKSHIRVTIVLSRFSSRIQGIMNAVTRFLALLLYLAVAYQTGTRGWESLFADHPPVTLQLGISLAPFLLVAGIGFFTLALELLVDFFHSLAEARGREVAAEKAAR